jgi:hypothetical protein
MSASSRIELFTRRVLAACLDIRAVWWIDHAAAAPSPDAARQRLLAFADASVLRRLRMRDELHVPDIEVLVVVDGDAFDSAWGPSAFSGSLARWAWRQATPSEAYYDESRWAQSGDGSRAVERVRRRAFLVWPK